MKRVFSGRDCLRIQRVAAEHLDVLMNYEEAEVLWENHSQDLAAGWLNLPDTDEELADELKDVINNDLRSERL